jgi:hypothetical protein
MTWMTISEEERNAESALVADSYKRVFPQFCSWEQAAKRAIAAMTAFDLGTCK